MMDRQIQPSILTAKQWVKILSSVSLGTVLSVSFGWGQATLAQGVNSPNPEPFQSNEVDSFGGGTFGNSLNPFDLIHRNTTGPGRTTEDFQDDTNTSLDAAAAEFKRQQQQRWQNQQQLQPATSPTSGN